MIDRSLSLLRAQVNNPFLDLVFQPPPVERFALRKSFKGHLNSVSAVAYHPRKVGYITSLRSFTVNLTLCHDTFSTPRTDLRGALSLRHFAKHTKGELQDQANFVAHLPSVRALDLHCARIGQAILATVSDDETWKVWSVPNCDLLMSGEGHRDWVSSVSFHPQGTMIATGAGDNTIKIWDFLQVGVSPESK